MGIHICSIQVAGPIGGHLRGKKGGNLTNLLMNHWPDCINIWHGTPLGTRRSHMATI